jgi:hypothetical protein
MRRRDFLRAGAVARCAAALPACEIGEEKPARVWEEVKVA